MTISPSRYHMELLATEIGWHLPCFIIYPDGSILPVSQLWGNVIKRILDAPGDRPLYEGRPIVEIQQCQQHKRHQRGPGVYLYLGEKEAAHE